MDVGSLVDQLNSFETPAEIAIFLENKGAKGDMQEEHSCVITNWLHDCTGLEILTGDCIQVVDYDEHYNYKSTDFPISGPVIQFIAEFDNGKYPNLVMEYDNWDEWEEEHDNGF